jgi:hypothetical protein
MLGSFMDHEMVEVSVKGVKKIKPKSILKYNEKMGGVDFIDKGLAPYKMLRKSIKWYKKLAFQLIQLTLHNSFVIYAHYHKAAKICFKNFLITLVRQILENNRISRKRKVPILPIMNESHLPVKNLLNSGKTSKSNCHLCWKNGVRKQTPFSCQECRKRFCIDGPDSCFKRFHENYKVSRVGIESNIQHVNK